MQPSQQASARKPSVPTPSITTPKPSAARTVERRLELRQERLVSAWLRSLATTR